MAPKTGKRGKKKGPSKRQRRLTMTRFGGMDGAAAAYAELLNDPCNGPLVNGPFADGGGGIVSRFRKNATWFYSAGTVTALAYVFVPGENYYSIASVPGPSTVINLTTNSANVLVSEKGPGYDFLFANAGSYRALSACVRIVYDGAELNRAGTVGMQCVPTADLGVATTINDLLVQCPNTERMPSDYVEHKWRPNNDDMMANNYVNLESVNQWIKGNAIVGVVILQPNTSVRFETTSVIEWHPKSSVGIAAPVPKVQSVSTYQSVLHYLDSTGNWIYHNSESAKRAATSVYRAVSSAKSLYSGVSKMAPYLLA